MQLERLHNSYKYRCVQTVENSMSEVFKYDDFKYSLKVRQKLQNNVLKKLLLFPAIAEK